ncbi:hypothetical protein [Streptomyces peucetius]|uniref:DUF3558 domain-containing protein n=1 Tax=Streptomyces peucetius TaxID=1950 RepID=A0ABY6IHD1_STRPE|nr:hypothetical protein [Streptomyces peucetius]UYQ65580.1 hypothetical protein OGH68_31685 [Streptomyces peucetius]
MTKARRRSAALAITACLALSLAACGGGREYTVPEEACGVTLDETKLDPFLFDGKKLKVTGESLIETGEDTRGHCEIRVDGKKVIWIRVSKVDRLYDPMDPSEDFRFRNREKLNDLPFAGLGALGDASAMVNTGCGGPKADHISVLVTVDGQAGGDVDERRKQIESFIVDFVPKVKKQLGCTV